MSWTRFAILLGFLLAAGSATAFAVYPIAFPIPLAEATVGIDDAEGRAWLDAGITAEVRGSFSEAEVLAALSIRPAAPGWTQGIIVEQSASLPLHERFDWAKTTITLNASRTEVFKPETEYEVWFDDKPLISFTTITLPKVVDVRMESPDDVGSDKEATTTNDTVILTFNERVVWDDERLEIDPPAEMEVRTRNVAGDGTVYRTELWITPAARWENETTYELLVQKRVKDIFGHFGREPFSFTFTTWPPPEILEAGPAKASMPPDTEVTVTFERPADRASVQKSFSVEPAAKGEFVWPDDQSLVWRPTAALPYSTKFKVSVAGNARGGDSFLPKEWEFRTQDPPVAVEIIGGDGGEAPAILKARVKGGLGKYALEWSNGEADEQIIALAPPGKKAPVSVTVKSGDQTAIASVELTGSPNLAVHKPQECPDGWQTIDISICYREERGAGPSNVYITRLDLNDPAIHLRSLPAFQSLGRPATVSESARSRGAVVAANADFFGLAQGSYYSLGPMVSGGGYVHLPQSSEAALALGEDMRSWVGPASSFQLVVDTEPGDWAQIRTVNSAQVNDGIGLFNSAWGSRLGLGGHRCYVSYRPDGPGRAVPLASGCGDVSNVALKEGEFVLVGVGSGAEWLSARAGRALRLAEIAPVASPIFAVGGSHVLIKDKVRPSLGASDRHPRTALGINRTGFAYLVVVDGRSAHSAGMTLAELQTYFARMGVINAINLDGGGSSTLAIGGKVMNAPSEGKERPVASVLEAVRGDGPRVCGTDFTPCLR